MDLKLVVNSFLTLLMLISSANVRAANDDEQILAVLDQYMAAVNEVDAESVVETYRFPHFRVARGDIVVWQTPIEAMPMLGKPRQKQLELMRKALGANWQRTEWVHRNIIAKSDRKAHVDTEFVRIDSSGKEMQRVNSLYILTRQDGVWLIKGRSSFSAR